MSKTRRLIKRIIFYLIATVSTMNLTLYFISIEILLIEYDWWIHWLMPVDVVALIVSTHIIDNT